MFTYKEQGVTFIELLVVVAIVGILAAISISLLSFGIREAKQKASMSQLQEIAKALEIYQLDNGDYPVIGNTPQPMSALTPFLVPLYMAALPETDPWGHPYYYSRFGGSSPPPPSGAHTAAVPFPVSDSYYLISMGSDGAVDDDVALLFPSLPTHAPLDKYQRDVVISRSTFIHLP